MKEIKLDSFLTPISERARSPLYSTFAISWLVSNWKIWSVILLFDKEDRGNLNIIDYLNNSGYFNCNNLFWYPLALTTLYIVALPWIDYLVLWYSEYMKRRKLDKKMEVGRKHTVSGDKYWDLKVLHDNMVSQFSITENELGNKNKEIQSLISSKQQLEHQNNEDKKLIKSLVKEKSETNKFPEANTFFKDFHWRIDYEDKNNHFPPRGLYQIKNNQLLIKTATSKNIGEIISFVYDYNKQHINFVLKNKTNNDNNVINEIVYISLQIITDGELSGYINVNTPIGFKREINSNI